MLKPEIKIGPLNFHLYGLIIAVAFYVGYILAKKRSKIYKIPEKFFDDPIIGLPFILGIIFARIYHILDYWTLYSHNPLLIFNIPAGGLGIWGGIFGFILGSYIVCKKKKIDFISVLDLVAPSALLGQAIGRLGNYINQEGFGPPTNLPWGVFINSQNRPQEYQNFSHFHPTFFYEAILNAIFFLVLIITAKNLKIGQAFALYLMFYAAARFIVEFARIDTWIVANIKVAHVFSLFAFTVGLYLFLRKNGNLKKKS